MKTCIIIRCNKHVKSLLLYSHLRALVGPALNGSVKTWVKVVPRWCRLQTKWHGSLCGEATASFVGGSVVAMVFRLSTCFLAFANTDTDIRVTYSVLGKMVRKRYLDSCVIVGEQIAGWVSR